MAPAVAILAGLDGLRNHDGIGQAHDGISFFSDQTTYRQKTRFSKNLTETIKKQKQAYQSKQKSRLEFPGSL